LATATTNDGPVGKNKRAYQTLSRILSLEEEQKFWADLFGLMIRHEERAMERAQKDRGGTGFYHRGTEVAEIENEDI
jgi:hypothetical protein